MLSRMKDYDAIIVLGSKPAPPDWKFPSHVYKSLDVTADLLNQAAAPYVIVSGKWALHYDALNIEQPFTEAEKMAEYLIKKGVDQRQILIETESKDTVSNFYYLKKQFLMPQNMHRILIVTADFRIERMRFLCDKILGPDYQFEFEAVDAKPEEVYPHEAETLQAQKKMLHDMKAGDEEFVGAKFYDDPYYEAVFERIRNHQ